MDSHAHGARSMSAIVEEIDIGIVSSEANIADWEHLRIEGLGDWLRFVMIRIDAHIATYKQTNKQNEINKHIYYSLNSRSLKEDIYYLQLQGRISSVYLVSFGQM